MKMTTAQRPQAARVFMPSRNGWQGKKKRGLRTRKPKGPVREWVEAIVFGVLVTTVIHMFLFQPFVVPTPSMAGTVPVGDYIIVSKLHYGPQTPTSVGIPILRFYAPGITLPSFRLPGFSDYKRGDIVAFHWPPDDKPMDQKQVYLKRLIGMPGDRITINNKMLQVNGESFMELPGQQHYRLVHLKRNQRLDEEDLARVGLHDVFKTNDARILLVNGNQQAIAKLAAIRAVETIDPYYVPQSEGIFPAGSGYTVDNYGPVTVPRRGDSVELDDSSWLLYGEVITRFEGHTGERMQDGTYTIDGEPARTYTFEGDYYFVMGDNRDDSLDSRFWGFVPENHMVGKAIGTFFSWNKERNSFRWSRFFRALN